MSALCSSTREQHQEGHCLDNRCGQGAYPPASHQAPRGSSMGGHVGVSARGHSQLVFVEDTVTAKSYTRLLGRALLPAARKLFSRRRWNLIHDGATPHTAAATQQWLHMKKATVLPLPPKSLDLSPIEKVRGYIKEKVAKSNPRSLRALKRAITCAWRSHSVDYLFCLVRRLPRVGQQIILKGGASVR